MVIVAAVDKSDRAEDVIREAEALAVAFDEAVHVVHALSSSDFVSLGRTSAKKGDSVNMDDVRKVATEIATDAAMELEVRSETVGLTGEPAAQIVKYAAKKDARYIVVAGRKKSPAGKAIFGSVAQSVLLKAECPVVSTIR